MPRPPSDPNIQTFSVRLTISQRGKLDEIAQHNGLEVSQLIRFAVDAFVRYVDIHGGVIHLPIDFTKSWESTPFVEPVTRQPSLRAAEGLPDSAFAATASKNVTYPRSKRASSGK